MCGPVWPHTTIAVLSNAASGAEMTHLTLKLFLVICGNGSNHTIEEVQSYQLCALWTQHVQKQQRVREMNMQRLAFEYHWPQSEGQARSSHTSVANVGYLTSYDRDGKLLMSFANSLISALQEHSVCPHWWNLQHVASPIFMHELLPWGRDIFLYRSLLS